MARRAPPGAREGVRELVREEARAAWGRVGRAEGREAESAARFALTDARHQLKELEDQLGMGSTGQ